MIVFLFYHERMLEEIFENKYYKLIKENLSAIILIPTILGWLQQIISLSIIWIPYIRFFSISQVIPDGLLVIWIILVVSLLTYATHIFFKKILTPIIEVWFTKLTNKILKRNWKIETEGPVFYILSILLIWAILFSLEIILKGNIYTSLLLMLIGILFVIEWVVEFFDKKERFSLIILTAILFVFLTNNLYSNPEDLININNVANKDTISQQNLKIRYMNDKYIFLEKKNGSWTLIEVKSFEDLLSQKK